MKTSLTALIFVCLYLHASPQIKSCYCHAGGDAQGVTISWDAYSLNDNNVILGCNIYKHISWNDTLVRLNENLITSLDSNYLYVDTGDFIDTIPPGYVIEAVTEGDTLQVAYCSAFLYIDFEVISTENIILRALPWDTVNCLKLVSIYRDGVQIAMISYDSIFESNLDFMIPYYDYAIFEFLSTWGISQDLVVTYEYLWNISHSVHIPQFQQYIVHDQNYPNPFTEYTTISFYISKKSYARLEIFDLKGDLIKIIDYGYLYPGQHSYKLNKNELTPGHYLYKISTDSEMVCKKMIIY
ncbi:MAG: T9SS type A sorting domain-containing protein [Bacteroidetes bacterium]|nr:T9SS type A sorting domain-containing protein [Bacteroidota bacterium]